MSHRTAGALEIVDIDRFLAAMRVRWTGEYGNVYSARLHRVWQHIGMALNYQAGPDADTRWPVLPAELGLGKTTAAKTWSAMLPDDYSALVVVRTREQAREFAADVNAWSGEKKAVALYAPSKELPNDYWLSPETTKLFPVVVACHKSYELGLDEFSLEAAQKRFDIIHTYVNKRRDVVIIDEALDQVAEAKIERGKMGVLFHLLRRVQFKHLGAMRVLESVSRALREAPLDRARALTAAELLALTDYDVPTATAHLDALWSAVRVERRVQPEARAIISEMLTVLRRHLATAPWTDENSVSSARLLRMPKGTTGVVLDATGALNNVYVARKREFAVRTMEPVRNYSNVTIFEARTNETGKVKVKKAATRIAEQTVRELVAHYGGQVGERRLLVVTAADTETQTAFRAQLAGTGFAAHDVTNWGAVDGRNDWRTFDTLLIASLHYGSSTQDVNTWLATQDLTPDDATLNAADEVRAIKERRIATTIAQAIGRLRLRTMTSEDGRCEPCDVFIRLPNFKGVVDSDKVMASVVSTLPGVARVAWEGASRKLRRDGKQPVVREDARAALAAYVARMAPGAWENAQDVRKALGISHGTWFRTAVDLDGIAARIEPAIGRRPARLVRL